MDDNLVGYLLETLDPVTRHRVEAQLASDPLARERLERLRRLLAPLAGDSDTDEPPPGLVINTLALVAEHQCRIPRAPAPRRSAANAGWRVRRIDALVAACLLVVVAGLMLSLLTSIWRGSARAACANNLRQLWAALSAHADLNDGQYPRVEEAGPHGVPGIVIPTLHDSGVLGDNISTDCVHGSQANLALTIADMERLYKERPEEYYATARRLCGTYAYSLGYYEEGRHSLCGLTRDSGDRLPVMANRAGPDGGNSTNHGGSGQNVLYVGGNVRWASHPSAGVGMDHIYLSHNRRLEAGVCREDTVLGAGDARPAPRGE
jgi:hypothetical protein